MKLLIVEDHPGIYYLLQMIAKEISPGIEINYFSDWKEAINSFQESMPDRVITDIQIGDLKQLDMIDECTKLKLPLMVFSSHINPTILQHCHEQRVLVVVSKSAPIEDLKKGVLHLIREKRYRCSVSDMNSNMLSFLRDDDIPRVNFTEAEEFVIWAQIEGKTTVELSKETNKSKYTIRNQRMRLMEKNECTMEELVRRYLYWHSKG